MTAIHYHVSSALKESETTPLSFKRKDWFFFFRDLPALDISNCVFNPPYFFALRTFDSITDFLCKPFFSKVKKNRVWRNDSSSYQTINRPEPVCMPYHIFSSYIEILQTSQQLFFLLFFRLFPKHIPNRKHIFNKNTGEHYKQKMNAWEQSESISKVHTHHRHTNIHKIPRSQTHTYTCTPQHKLPVPSQSSGLAERQQQRWCGAVCCSLCTHLSPPAILASVIPSVHLNTDADLSPVLWSYLTHVDTSGTNVADKV